MHFHVCIIAINQDIAYGDEFSTIFVSGLNLSQMTGLKKAYVLLIDHGSGYWKSQCSTVRIDQRE